MYVIGVRQFVGKEVDTLPTVLVCRLNDHVFSPVADCARGVLGLTRMEEIGVLPAQALSFRFGRCATALHALLPSASDHSQSAAR